MEDRRTLGPLTAARTVCILAVGAATVACASSPESPSGEGVPLPEATLAPPTGDASGPEMDEPGGDATESDAATPDAAPPEVGTSAPPAGDGAADGAASAAADAPTETPRWFPDPGTVLHLAGASPGDGDRLLETRTVEAGRAGALSMRVAISSAGGDTGDIARETYVVRITDDEVRIALEPDGVRDLPPSAREVTRRPTKGDRWHTPSGRCQVEEVGVDAETFLGTRSGCVRIRLTSRTGSHSTRWFDPQLGEVRREVRDRRGKLIAAWALCDATPPADDRYEPVLLGDK